MNFETLATTCLDIIAEIKKEFHVDIFIHDHEHLISSSQVSKLFHLRHDHPFCEQQRHEKKEWFDNCRRCCSIETNLEIKKNKLTIHGKCWKNAEQIIHPVFEKNTLIFTIFAGPFRSGLNKQNKNQPILPELSNAKINQLKFYLHSLHIHLQNEFINLPTKISGGKSRKRQIENYLENNHDKNISLSSLSKFINLSESRTSHLLKEEFVQSFNDLLLEIRIRKAKLLLLHSKLTSTEIAQKVGFKNPNYFFVCFKKSIGMSPKEFQKSLLNPI